MSLVGRRSALLSIAPQLVTGEHWMLASTSRMWTALTLFSYRRELRVDARKERIIIDERRLWRTRRTELRFEEVDHISYHYGELPTSFFSTFAARSYTLQTADAVEQFEVELVLKSGEQLPLFSFVGDGERMTGWLGVAMGDSVLDFQGEQEAESLTFVRELERLTRLPLGPALPAGVERRAGPPCPECGQANVPRARCLYCGARLA